MVTKKPTADEIAAPAEAAADTTNQATRLLDLARKHYRLVRSEDGEAYGVKKAGPNIAIPLGRGGAFGNHLIRLFYEAEGKAPSDDAERTAVKIMRAYLDEQDAEQVHLRVARHDHGVVMDLGTADGSCVIVTAGGWRIEASSPVVFRRGAGLSLPVPQRDSDGLSRLRALVNASEDQFRLGVAWLTAALIPGIPHPILLPRGEQGSAKTTLSRIFQAVIDPSGMKPGVLPKDERDFAVRMTAAYVQAFDNVSNIPPWLSDALCRAATGDSFVTRTLYTDRDVTILQYARPIILNTIDAGGLSGDLVERSAPLDLDRIAPENRRTERAAIGDDPETNPGLYDQLDKDRPAILGAILDLVAAVFENTPGIAVGNLPRMADFGKILAALDKARDWNIGKLFSDLVNSETGALIEGSPFASRLVEFMESREEWQGTATEIRAELTAMLPDKDHLPKGWPPDATRAGGQLRRLAPSLRVHRIEVDSDREGRGGTRTWKVRKIASAASAASPTHFDLGKQGDANTDSADAGDASVGLASPVASAAFPQLDGGFPLTPDAADAADAESHGSDDSWVREPPGDLEHGWPDDETGECAKCRAPCHKYGQGGNPLCPACQDTRPRPDPAGTDWLRRQGGSRNE